jgi:hypothetical protein
MVVKLQDSDGVKVYNITADKVLPAWVQKKKGSKLSRDVDYAKHVDLVQVRPNRELPCTAEKQDQRHISSEHCQYHAVASTRASPTTLACITRLPLAGNYHSDLIDFILLDDAYCQEGMLLMRATFASSSVACRTSASHQRVTTSRQRQTGSTSLRVECMPPVCAFTMSTISP